MITVSPQIITLLHEGDTVRVALQGATIYSYQHAGIERLFTSTKSDIGGPAAIRGGIPICWPIFGPPPKDNELYSKLKQHGFARSSIWTFVEEESGDKGNAAVAVFALTPTEHIQSLYAPPFSLKYVVTLSAASLQAKLHVHSPSNAVQPLEFQALLHAYFRLPSSVTPVEVQVTPLNGLKYADKVQGNKAFTEDRDVVEVVGPKGEVDRVYFDAPDNLELAYKGEKGGIKVVKSGLSDVVLWNPGPEKGATIADMEEGGAGRYVCLEPGQTGTFVALAPGEDWAGGITITVSDK